MRSLLLSAVALLFLTGSLCAQAVTVQQPVIGVTSVNTTVSVPDRGSIQLGGVNSAAMGRSSFGFPRTSTSTGLQLQGSSMSAHVYIHDLRAMDEALLATAPDRTPDDRWSKMLATRRGAGSSAPVAPFPTPSRAAEFEARALKAEQNGKAAVALTYWRLAAKDGSVTALRKIAEALAKR